ncbi:MAG TPA: hypothetical protein VND19_17525 [Acetobacteraceae bacterium]|nr:hypothetical protein [Acetobacteraceae bacterium]
MPGPADRVRPFEDDRAGLLSAEGRKSVAPLAAVTAPESRAAQHRPLPRLVAQAAWSDQAGLTRVRKPVPPADMSSERLIDQARLCRRIERDCLELRQAVGLGHYADHGWRALPRCPCCGRMPRTPHEQLE